MTVKSRRPMDDRPSPRQQAGDLPRTKKPAGRPKGEPSTIVNVAPTHPGRPLDRYLDRLEGQTGLKANRGMIARRALELFLASHAVESPRGGQVKRWYCRQ